MRHERNRADAAHGALVIDQSASAKVAWLQKD